MTEPLDARPTGRDRTPPGQILTRKWPVLHYGHVPRIDLATWRFRIWGAVEEPLELGWAAFEALPRREVLCDIHCVTRWSRLDNRFAGVPVRELLGRVRLLPSASHVLVHAAPDYTTNLPLEDLDRAENLLATHHDGEPLAPEHGGPIRLLVPHLYFWKSAKWVTGFEIMEGDAPGFWEENGYHMYGDPWAEQRFGRPDYARMRRGPRR
jgi:DMSO/TMAO reductase YedYZ molybdopterin-dependent catalytic subunit